MFGVDPWGLGSSCIQTPGVYYLFSSTGLSSSSCFHSMAILWIARIEPVIAVIICATSFIVTSFVLNTIILHERTMCQVGEQR